MQFERKRRVVFFFFVYNNKHIFGKRRHDKYIRDATKRKKGTYKLYAIATDEIVASPGGAKRGFFFLSLSLSARLEALGIKG